MTLLILLLLLPQDETASESALKEQTERVLVVHDAIRKTAVIAITASGKDNPAGTRAVVTEDGYIVTCAHVVEAASQLGVSMKADVFKVILSDGKVRSAKLVATNSTNDIALLKIEGEKLAHFDLSKDRRPARNDSVVALGFPLGNVGTSSVWSEETPPHASIALGRVTDSNRKFFVQTTHQKYYPDCIESDVPVFFGNSGGPMIDAKGELLGLNAAISKTGQTFTLSVGSIARCFEDLKSGKDVAGEKPGENTSWKDYGRALWDSLGASEPSTAPRAYLKEPFADLAKARRGGAVALYRGKVRLGYATVMDDEGRLVASLRTLDHKSVWSRIGGEIEDGLEGDLKKLWKSAREALGGKDAPLEAVLPSGRRVAVTREKSSDRLGLALLKLDSGDEKLEPLRSGRVDKLKPGSWVAVLGTGEPVAVGLLSAPSHTVTAGRTPLSATELLDAWSNRDLEHKEFKNIILFDAPLTAAQLGTPLCDAKGRMIGVTIFHPSRGTSYAVPVVEVRKEFGLGK